MTTPQLPYCYGHVGIWMVYDQHETLVVMSIHRVPEEAARIQAKQAYGRVGFWPIGWELKAAVDWWEEKGDSIAKERDGATEDSTEPESD